MHLMCIWSLIFNCWSCIPSVSRVCTKHVQCEKYNLCGQWICKRRHIHNAYQMWIMNTQCIPNVHALHNQCNDKSMYGIPAIKSSYIPNVDQVYTNKNHQAKLHTVNVQCIPCVDHACPI